MHIPDGFLTVNVWLSAWLIAFGGIGFCLRKTTRLLKEKMVPLMGVMSAFIFAAQMLNFPVISGTSGHLLGGIIAAVLLGPYAAAVVITSVLMVQCLIFQDGGVTTLGANILNMALLGTLGGYLIYRTIKSFSGSERKGILLATAVSAWSSVVFAACACAVELVLSGTSPLKIVLPAMAGVHALIGIGEAIISFLLVSFILKIRPDLIYKP